MKRFALLLLLLTFGLTGAVAAQEATPEIVTPQDLADPDGQFVDIEGVSVYYRQAGPADGPAVLLLHGFLGSTVNWDDTIPVLAEAGYHVIAFDRPPFGLSDKRPELDYSLEAQAALTAGLMDKLGIDRAALVGHSAGGAVAAQFALAYPERVSKLVLVAGAIGLNAADDAADSQASQAFSFLRDADPNNPLAQLALRAFFTSDFARNMLRESVSDPDRVTPELVERNSAYLKLRGWEAGLLAFTRDAQFDKPDLDSLAKMEIPVLLLWGEDDNTVPLAVGERLRDTFPNDTWKPYPNAGHMLMLDAGEAMHADLLAFLAE
ncbi:MAG: alpha/beta hydrolase [Chloroflexi bacterium]|nr:alpha/beta hydrolase [Chloroflexota bacterium]